MFYEYLIYFSRFDINFAKKWHFYKCFSSHLSGEFITLNIPYDQVDAVHIPDGITKSDYTKITVEFGFKSLPNSIFKDFVNVDDIELPDSIEIIDDQAFSNTKIKYFRIPKNLSLVSSSNPFDDAVYLEYFDAPPDCVGFTTIDGVLFNKNMTELIQFPRSKKLTKYIVPSEVETIGFSAFKASKYIEKVILPENLKNIGRYAFYAMGTKLKSIIVLRSHFSPNLEIIDNAFDYTVIKSKDIQYMNLTQYMETECKIPTACQISRYAMNYNTFIVYVFIYL